MKRTPWEKYSALETFMTSARIFLHASNKIGRLYERSHHFYCYMTNIRIIRAYILLCTNDTFLVAEKGGFNFYLQTRPIRFFPLDTERATSWASLHCKPYLLELEV